MGFWCVCVFVVLSFPPILFCAATHIDTFEIVAVKIVSLQLFLLFK